MAIYAVGNEHDSYQVHAGAFLNGAGGTVDPGGRYTMVTTNSDRLRLNLNTSVSECWIHGRTYPSGGTHDTNPLIEFYNRTNSRSSFRWVTPATGGVSTQHKLQYSSDGSTWNNLVTFDMPVSADRVFDIYFKGGASGQVKVFLAGQLIASASGSYTLQDTTWDAVVLGSAVGSTHYWGSIIVASESTINWQIDTIEATGAGNSSAWTGTYADINEASYDEGTFINSNTTGQKFLAALADTTVAASRAVKAVVVAARGNIASGASITNISFLARHAATDYTLANTGLTAGGGNASAQQVLELDPASAAWTESSVNALQLGVITS